MMFARRRFLLRAFETLDVSVMLCAFGIAIVVPYYEIGRTVSFSNFLHVRVEVHNFFIFLGLGTAWHLSFRSFGLYESRRMSSRWSEIRDVVKATCVGVLVFMAASVLFRIRLATPAFLGTFWILATGLTVITRVALRYFLHTVRRRGRNLRNLLVVGTNSRAFEFARQILARPELGYQIAGFADTPREIPWDEQLANCGLVTDFAGFPTYLRTHVVDEVVVSLPLKSLYSEASRVVAICQEQGIVVRFLSNVFDSRPGCAHIDEFEDRPVVTVSSESMHGLAMVVKRALDVCVSALLLVMLAPLAGMVILAIRLTSRGPAIFAHERLGLNKRRFRLYKFRTMVDGAEARQAELEPLNEVSGPVFKIRNDPRITRIGRILRKTSIDELPQLINVLKGDMSMVGPRPLPVRDYEGFDADWHRRRFSVKPGITCLWQVNGRSDTSFDRWMELDMEYIDSWSLRLDLKILAMTIPAVLGRQGAH
jgi:exopolysaccharide biosynthesis polyprenyl glycosylphosphotransferase